VLLDLRDDDGEQSGRDREVERVVATSALLLVELVHCPAEPLPGVVVVELAGDEPDASSKLLPHRLAPRRTSPVLGSLLDHLGERLFAEVLTREADQGEARRQQSTVGEVVYRGNELLLGKVAGDAEQDEAARTGNARESAIARIAQWVVIDHESLLAGKHGTERPESGGHIAEVEAYNRATAFAQHRRVASRL